MACTTKTEYRHIKPVIPEPPPEPAYYPVEFRKFETDGGPFYCLDKENAVNLLKNQELQRAYTEKLRTILRLLKERYRDGGQG